tara:strand:- start:1818 stop:2084 length:267 start_codon:yes stop_codon:yes gene_type:complete
MRMKTYAFLAKTYTKKYMGDAKDAMRTLGAKAKIGQKKIKKKYKSLHPMTQVGLEGFGKGIKYGTLGVGAIEVGKGAYRTVTGKKKEK